MAIFSLKFTGKGKYDYLNKRLYDNQLKKGFTQKDYTEALSDPQRYKKYGRDITSYFFDEVDMGYKNDLARECLVGKTFNFSTDKINIIYGRNASGKSTILKTIAANALCGSNMQFDGYTNPLVYTPLDYMLDDINIDFIKEKNINKAGNNYEIEWDGNTVYYHNYSNRKNYGTFNDFEGSIIGSTADNLFYNLHKDTLSDGKQTLYIFSKLFDIAEQNKKVKEICNECLVSHEAKQNDYWYAAARNGVEYLMSLYCFARKQQNTILLDEIDKSLDVLNTAYIFTDLLPRLQSINNQQIIVVSHSPLVLSETICNPDKYNLISMDEDYTKKIKNTLSKLKF